GFQIAGAIEIELVANPIGRTIECFSRLWCTGIGIAWTEPDNAQKSGVAAAQIQNWARRPRYGDGRAARFRFFDDQLAVWAGGAQRGALGATGRAALFQNQLRGVLEPCRFRRKLGGGEKS